MKAAKSILFPQRVLRHMLEEMIRLSCSRFGVGVHTACSCRPGCFSDAFVHCDSLATLHSWLLGVCIGALCFVNALY